ncbi:peptidoglycan-binding domain-containing protein [Leifsonia shinshuensis]|uniref:Peptidoglycan-binding protein n=1 Tax=Leifsonia shinshuensis TaxID=150026 RepID=A0A7G6YEN4_9MICO|nr:hypothetical protein [Leifsonia shinshuensis]QNE36949.1 hypothetical protein F1C12_18740 [Leifsonia shinshuensis]
MAILAVAAASAGAAGAVTALAGPPPTLRSAIPTKELPVGHDRFEDARSVQLSVRTSLPVSLPAPANGRVTSFSCEPGASVVSGSSPVSIDGRPYLALSTRVPLWRDLTPESKGDDVRALQEELRRLGHQLESDGTLGRKTMRAAAAAFARVGVNIAPDSVPAASVIWLPAPAVAVSRCELPAGTLVDQGATMATFASLSPVVSVIGLPGDLVSGPRAAIVGGTSLAVDGEGVVQDPDVSALAAEVGMDTSAVEVKPIDARLVLAEPIDVSVVVPSAIFGVDGARGCVVSRGVTHSVEILGSQLGQTIVVFPDGKAPERVDTRPAAHSSCR